MALRNDLKSARVVEQQFAATALQAGGLPLPPGGKGSASDTFTLFVTCLHRQLVLASR
jgi:hypothetical protein